MSWARKAVALVLENVNGLAVLAGAIWLYIGVAGVSVHAANALAGGLLLAIGAFPYVMRRRRKP